MTLEQITDHAQDLADSGGPPFALSVQRGLTPSDPFRCPSCGESYPLRGTCWGYGPDKHDPVETERVHG